MHSSFSYLRSAVERIRTTLDSSRIDGGKYDDSYICSYMLSSAMSNVISRLSHTSGCRILQSFRLTPVANQLRYALPPCIEAVIRLQFTDSLGNRLGEIQPSSPWSASGQGWRLEGTPGLLSIVFDNSPIATEVLDIIYVGNGDWQPHLGIGNLATATATSQTLSLLPTPTLGTLDRRDSAYLGSHVRILSADPAPIQERRITRHYFDSGAWKVDFEPLSPAVTGSVEYEIAVPGFGALHHAAAMLAAYDLSVSLSLSGAKQQGILTMYKVAMKTAGDNLTHMNRALGFYMERNTPGSYVSSMFGKN